MSDEYVQEACFYLSELKVATDEIAKQMNMNPAQVRTAILEHRRKMDEGVARYNEDTKQFWATVLREGSGDEKITMVDEKGSYYHGWKSEIEKLPTKDLIQILIVNKQYSDLHPLSEFSKSQPTIGYDPLIPLRNIRHTVTLIDSILQRREVEE